MGSVVVSLVITVTTAETVHALIIAMDMEDAQHKVYAYVKMDLLELTAQRPCATNNAAYTEECVTMGFASSVALIMLATHVRTARS